MKRRKKVGWLSKLDRIVITVIIIDILLAVGIVHFYR